MYKRNISDSPQRGGEGLISHIPLQKQDIERTDLSITWVEIKPGSMQQPHSHNPEQVYILISGNGKMSIDGESEPVIRGDIVHIPSNASHHIKNTGEELLIYVSASTPAYNFTTIYDKGELAE